MSTSYIAITIGPIFRTMNLSSSPSALWASSYLFSYIARRLQDRLIEDCGIEKESFICPYYSNGSEIFKKNDGVGLLHDHIIFEQPAEARDGESLKAKLVNVREMALLDAWNAFLNVGDTVSEPSIAHEEDSFQYLQKYVMISAVSFEANNPIRGSSNMLDCMELATSFVPREAKNPILDLFTNAGNEDGKNECILNQIQKMGIEGKDWQLASNTANGEIRIKDLGAIAKGEIEKTEDGAIDKESSRKKKHLYYAVVRADGDNMGKLIGSLTDKQQFQSFSETCLKYCRAVADAAKGFGGVAIYAGGDDLLALMPCENSKGETVLDFVHEANKTFREAFEEFCNKQKYDGDRPTLTFGITICHHKYPLYEALEDSADLLFGAKKKGYKNAVNLRLIKHSGQTSAVLIKNEVIDEEDVEGKPASLRKLLKDIIQNANSDEVLLSALHKLQQFRMLFNQASDSNVESLFENVFDATDHEGNDFVHEKLPAFYAEKILTDKIKALDEDGKILSPEDGSENLADSMYYLMRIFKFYTEKAGERE